MLLHALLSDSADQTSAYSGSPLEFTSLVSRRYTQMENQKKPFKTFSFSGYITQNRLSFGLKQGTKPDKKLSKGFLMHRILARMQVQSILP